VQPDEGRNRQPQQPVFVSDLIDHYLATELSEQRVWVALKNYSYQRAGEWIVWIVFGSTANARSLRI
jgi:hypothetical protein